MKSKTFALLNWGILVFFVVIGLNLGWILHLVSSQFPPYILPDPEAMIGELSSSPGDWAKAVAWTGGFSLIAAGLSVVLGTAVGVTAAYLRLWSIDKWAQLIWSIPLIAIATYLLLAVGFGWAYGLSLALFLGFFPIEKHVFDVCTSHAEGVSSIAASFGLSRRQEFFRLRLPTALRSLGTPLSQSLPLCFIGETMGEYTAGQISQFSIGLGGLLRFAQSFSDYPQLWLSIILMMLLVFCSGQLSRIAMERRFPVAEEREMLS